jgi:hypothetical protein
MPQKLISPYMPREWAKLFHETDKRWMVLVVHRRAGKTTAALNYLQRSALTKRNTRYAYIAPTYKMAKGVAWDILKKYSLFIPGIEHRESELTVVYPNGSKIILYGAENPDRLRGLGFSGVVFDEYGQQPNNIFTEVIRPGLIDNSGYAIWIGTPQGKNEFFRLYESRKNDSDWFNCHLTVDDTDTIPIEEIENAKKTMSHEEFMQELYCSFESVVKGAVYAEELRRARDEHRIGIFPFHRELKVHTVWDIGVGQALAIGFYQNVNGKTHMIDFWQGTESEGIEQAVLAVERKPYSYGTHFAPHDIKARESSTGRTRLDYAKGLGLSFNVMSPNNVDDGIQAGKFMFNRLMIDEEKCEKWLDAISEYKREWDDKRGMFKEIPYHNWTSHAADVHRYAAIVEKKMVDSYEQSYSGSIGELPSNIGDPYY